MQDLSIQFEQEQPKRHLRSNIKTYATIACIVLLAILPFRLWITRDTVSNFHSNETSASVQVFKNFGNVNTLNNVLGSVALLGPITMNDVINLSNREFAVHFNELGQISEISIDTELNEQKRNELELIGINTIELKGRTLISINSIESFTNPSTNFTIHSLNPFFDGKIRSYDQDGWLSVNESGLILHGFGEKPEIQTELSIPQNSELIAQISSTGTKTEMANQLGLLASTPLFLIIEGLNNPWKLVLAQTQEGDIAYSILIEQNLDINELAEMAKYISSLSNLSTTALTLDDGSSNLEIRVLEEPDISITTDQDTHFLHLSQNDNELHLTQTPTHLLITNHNTPPSLENNHIEGLCKSNAHTFAYLNIVNSDTSGASILNTIDSMAINSHSIYFCW